jgi:hypothetical protein
MSGSNLWTSRTRWRRPGREWSTTHYNLVIPNARRAEGSLESLSLSKPSLDNLWIRIPPSLLAVLARLVRNDRWFWEREGEAE